MHQHPDRQQDQLLVKLRAGQAGIAAKIGHKIRGLHTLSLPGSDQNALRRVLRYFPIMGLRILIRPVSVKTAQIGRMKGNRGMNLFLQPLRGLVFKSGGRVEKDPFLMNLHISVQIVSFFNKIFPFALFLEVGRLSPDFNGALDVKRIRPVRNVDGPEVRDGFSRFQFIRRQRMRSQVSAVGFFALLAGDLEGNDLCRPLRFRHIPCQHHVGAAEAAVAAHFSFRRIQHRAALGTVIFRDFNFLRFLLGGKVGDGRQISALSALHLS